MLAPVLLALLGLMLLGGVLIALGVRGKRLNNHPTCRWCNFDLENIYPTGVTCPECGAGLKRERAVRIGQRRRRPLFILAGVLFVLTPLAPIGTVLFAAVTGVDVNRYKPLGLLLWEVDRVEAKKEALIAGEFLSRLQSAGVDLAQEQRILAYTMDRQADPGRAWGKEWSDLVDRLRLNGRMTKSEQQRALVQSVMPKVTARPRATAGGVLPFSIEHELRAGSDQAVGTIWLESARINGVALNRSSPEPGHDFPLTAPSYGPLATVWIMPNAAGWGMNSEPASVAVLRLKDDVPAGPATLELELLVSVEKFDTGSFGVAFNSNRKPKATSPKVRTVRLSAPVEVLPKGVPSVERVPAGEQLSAALAKKLRPSQLTYSREFFSSTVQADFSVADLPVPVIFDVFARPIDYVEGVSAKEVRLGTITSGTAGFQWGGFGNMGTPGSSTRSLWYNGRPPKGEKIDLVLRPRPDLAASTMDLTRVYDGEVVLKGVEVVRPGTKYPRATAPATTEDDSESTSSGSGSSE